MAASYQQSYSNGKLEVVKRLLGIFERYPLLACYSFPHAVPPVTMPDTDPLMRLMVERPSSMDPPITSTPLHIWLKAGVNALKSIKALCKACDDGADGLPKLLKTKGGGEAGFPVHSACQFSSSIEVIDFMWAMTKQHHPTFMQERDGSHQTPIAIASRNKKIPGKTLKTLLQQCPEELGNQGLFSSFLWFHPTYFLEFVVHIWPNSLTRCSINLPTISMEQTLIVCKLLPKLKYLTISVENNDAWEGRSFLVFLQHFLQNKSVTSIRDLSIPSVEGLDKQLKHEILQTFQQVLESTTSGMYLLSREKRLIIVEEWFYTIDKGVANNTPRHLFEFDFHPFHDGFRGPRLNIGRGLCKHFGLRVSRFDAKKNKPLLELLRRVAILKSFRFLHFESGTFGNPQGKEVCAQLVTDLLSSHEHGFRELNIEANFEDDEIHSICQVLQSNKILRSLTVRPLPGITAPPEKRSKVTAEWLRVLQDHNLTLTHLYPWVWWDPRIPYLLYFNRLGRSTVRSLEVAGDETNKQLVDLLSNARVAVFDNAESEHESSLIRQSVVYGLLREAPALWCNIQHASVTSERGPPQSRKRKGNFL